jgi:uncharacterized protein
MSVKSYIHAVALALTISFAAPAVYADDASMHQVYQAAEAGKFNQAQAMMDKVLHDHPNSAKAHYVEAELMAKQGQYANAQNELNTAQGLQPGLSFVKPAALEKLKVEISQSHNSIQTFSNHVNPVTHHSGTPWGMILMMIALIAFIYLAAKWMVRRNPPAMPSNYYGNNPNINPQPYGAVPPTQSGGLGSSIIGGLATGAAVGAGMVAGEALMHHFTDANPSSNGFINNAQANENNGFINNDMGGSDFGIADNASWDDDSGSGDDWT